LTINNIFEMFLKRFPQLNAEINKNLTDGMIDRNDGLYVLWGMGIMPSVNRIIDNCGKNEDLVSGIFDFFEEMANADDEELKELLMYSTLETLGDDDNRLEISRKLMKNETIKLSEKVETFLGR